MHPSDPGSSRTDQGKGLLAVVAALPEEVAPLWRRLTSRRVERVGVGKARSGVLAGRAIVVMATGDGATRAQRGLAQLGERYRLRGVLAIGIAGGLSPDLDVGDVVVAHTVHNGTGEVPAPDRALVARASEVEGVRAGVVYSHSEVAVDPVAKQRLWRAGGEMPQMVVDLESASYARESARRSVPYMVLRAVSDSSDEALPLDFNRFRRPDGSSDRWRVLGQALVRPSIVPELLQLRDRLRYCAGQLADCVEAVLRR